MPFEWLKFQIITMPRVGEDIEWHELSTGVQNVTDVLQGNRHSHKTKHSHHMAQQFCFVMKTFVHTEACTQVLRAA